MGYSIDVSTATFQKEAIEKSYELPVLVDFYATWCGPCQILRPILEGVAREYDCVVAKLDTEANPEIASTYRIEGVPDVRVFRDGKPIDGFVGVLPSDRLADFLKACGVRSRVGEGLEAARQHAEAGRAEKADAAYAALREAYPENRMVLLETAYFWIQTDRLQEARSLLTEIPSDERDFHSRAKALDAIVGFKQECQNPVGDGELDCLYAKACCCAAAENYEEALQGFIEIVGHDRKYRDDGARKATLAIFDLLGGTHPLTMEYRRQLTMVLF